MRKIVVFTVALLCLTGATWAEVVTINGGSYTGPYYNDGQDVIINGGNFDDSRSSAYACPFDNMRGTITVNGGVFNGTTSASYGRGFYNRSNNTVTINNGEFNGAASNYGYGFINDGTAIITGGKFNGTATTYFAYGFSNRGTAIITGGEFNATATTSAVGLDNSGAMIIYGTFAHYGELPKLGGTISGMLANGVYTTIKYTNLGSICLRPVPEPSSILALLCGIGGMSSVVLRRRLAERI